MKRSYATLVLSVLASFPLTLQVSSTVHAVEPTVGQKPIPLSAILEQEAAGGLVDRRRSLEEGKALQNEVASWHAGRLKVDGAWKSVEDLTAGGAPGEYLALRTELKADPQMHLKLARWCARHDYQPQARAHFYGLLAKEPNHLEARAALGHIQFGDQWIDKTELKDAQLRTKDMLAQLDGWVPRLEPIAKALRSGKAQQKTEALKELDKIDAVAALPALEMFAVNVDDDLAMPLIRKIAGVRSREACLALVRVALAHPSAEVRRQSTLTIRSYPEHFYVPELLGMLSGEIEVENRLVMQPNGQIGLTTLVRTELQNRKQLQRFEKNVKVVSAFSFSHTASHQVTGTADASIWSVQRKIPKSSPVHIGNVTGTVYATGASASAAGIYVPQEVAVSAAQNLSQQGKRQEYLANRQNRLSKEKMIPVFNLLRETTGQTLDDQPESWWAWWIDRNERYNQGAKPTTYAYNQQRDQITITSQAYSSSSTSNSKDFGPILTQVSCLVPGTLVQTEQGLVPIEKIEIGDLVLSQDPETAELALKPVLLTTVRAPKPTIRIHSDESNIEATGGHLWWVSGRGWTKSRDLQPGMKLHTATGNVEIREVVEDALPQQTHNLVVDGFHTYFVGPNRVLSYDNSQVKPCLHAVPGFGVLLN